MQNQNPYQSQELKFHDTEKYRPTINLEFYPNPTSFSYTETIKIAFEATKKHWLIGSLIILVTYITFFVFSFVMQLLPMFIGFLGITEITIVTTVILGIVSVVLQIIVQFIMLWLGNLAVRLTQANQNLEMNLMLIGFTYFLRIIGIYLANLILLVLVSIPGLAIIGISSFVFSNGDLKRVVALLEQGEPILILSFCIGALLVFIADIFILVRLHFASLLCVDYKLEIIPALKASWSITEGKVFELIGFTIVFGLLNFVLMPFYLVFIVFTCLMGSLPILLFYSSGTAAVYNQLIKHLKMELSTVQDTSAIEKITPSDS